MLGYHPPGADTPKQTPPLGADTPRGQTPPIPTPRSRHPHPPRSRHSPRNRHPPRSRHPPQSRHPPEQTPPSRHSRADTPQSRHPPEQTTPRADTPPESRLQDTVNERPVRILLKCILVQSIFKKKQESIPVGSRMTRLQ